MPKKKYRTYINVCMHLREKHMVRNSTHGTHILTSTIGCILLLLAASFILPYASAQGTTKMALEAKRIALLRKRVMILFSIQGKVGFSMAPHPINPPVHWPMQRLAMYGMTGPLSNLPKVIIIGL